MANRCVYPSSLFPLRGDLSAEAGATSVLVTGIQGTPVNAGYSLNAYDTLLYNENAGVFVFGSPWQIPVGQVLEFEGYGYTPVGISWLASDTIAIGDGTQGDVSGAAAMTALILFGSLGYDYGYEQNYTTIYSGAHVNWNLTLPPNAGSNGQVLTTNGSGVTSWTTPSGSSSTITLNPQTGTTYTIQSTDLVKLVTFSNTSSTAVTLPQAGGSFPSGWYCYVQNLNTGFVTITPTTSTINGWTEIQVAPRQWALIVSDGTNYDAFFTQIASSDSASSLSSYLTVDANPVVCPNQIVVQDLSVSGVNTKRKGFNIFLESNGILSSNIDGLQVNVGATIVAGTAASQVEAAEFFVFASGSAATLAQMNGVKIRTSVAASTTVAVVNGLLFYLPELFGTVTDFTGILFDAPIGGGTITNYVGANLGNNLNGVTVTNAAAVSAVLEGSPTNGYGLIVQANTAAIVADDSTAASSFIGHGAVGGSTYPSALHDGWYSGTGSPQSVLSANPGSMFSNRSGGVEASFYIKESGSGNTGWAPVLTSAGSPGGSFAGQATVVATATSIAVSFAANYTGVSQPVVVITPTADPLLTGTPVGYWVTPTGSTTAWTGFTIYIQSALASDITFNYLVVGQA